MRQAEAIDRFELVEFLTNRLNTRATWISLEISKQRQGPVAAKRRQQLV